VIDQETNNLSLSDILENLAVEVSSLEDVKGKSFNVPINYEVVSYIVKTDLSKAVSAKVELNIVDPNGKVVSTYQAPFEMPLGMDRMRTRLRIEGLVVTTAGNYSFKISLSESGSEKFKQVAEIPFDVKISVKGSTQKIEV